MISNSGRNSWVDGLGRRLVASRWLEQLGRIVTFDAPGRHFSQGMSLVEATRLFPIDAAAGARMRWPRDPACPHCGSAR